MPPGSINQTPEQIARDQIGAKLTAADWHIQHEVKRFQFCAKTAQPGKS
jgi:type I site-specific restriction endonuclease